MGQQAVISPCSSARHPVIVASSQQLQALLPHQEDHEAASSCPLPPKDETYDSPLSALRELRAAPDLPEGADRYDRIGLETGGVWRSKRYGFVPATVSIVVSKQ